LLLAIRWLSRRLTEPVQSLPRVVSDITRSGDLSRRARVADLAFIEEDTLKIIRSGKSGAARIKDIVSSLRSFSRLDEAELKSVLLDDGINDTLALLHHHIKNRIEVSHDYRPNEPVMRRAGQINQVFMNIIYNALQAIDGPGRLQIGTNWGCPRPRPGTWG